MQGVEDVEGAPVISSIPPEIDRILLYASRLDPLSTYARLINTAYLPHAGKMIWQSRLEQCDAAVVL